MARVLLAGESWITHATHYKGFDSFESVTFHTGADDFIAAVGRQGIEVEQMYAHDVPDRFPRTMDALSAYDVVILSDIGANSFYLAQATWLQGQSQPNRLRLLGEWVRGGGGLLMAGGYMSFQGFQGRANFARSPLAEVLPVAMSDYDDRVESPEGARPSLIRPDHPIGAAWRGSPPAILGYNRVTAKPEATVVATVGDDVLIAVAEVGAGRSAVWTTDIGPHWCPAELLQWEGFEQLMAALIRWLRREI